MKLAFVSNFMNHHQRPLSLALAETPGVDYRFVATEPFTGFGVSAGYRDMNKEDDFILRPYESEEQKKEALAFCRDADVVIIGSAPDEYIKDRLKENKLTFRYYERFFKAGKWRILDPRVLLSCYRHHTRYRNKNLSMLCASAYTAPDCKFIRAYPGKTYKWGYFPAVPSLDADDVIAQKNREKLSILWAGRLIDLKHPEEALAVAKHLKDRGVELTLTMRGNGPLLDPMKETAKALGVEEFVSFPGATSPEEIQNEMRKSDIFLFTSDQHEGWGAVLNESLSNCCAVVARKQIGSVPFLIEDGKNGLVYGEKNGKTLFDCVDQLANDVNLRKKLQANAYRTMKDEWCAEQAAKRLLALIEALQSGKETPFLSGPCSRAE